MELIAVNIKGEKCYAMPSQVQDAGLELWSEHEAREAAPKGDDKPPQVPAKGTGRRPKGNGKG